MTRHFTTRSFFLLCATHALIALPALAKGDEPFRAPPLTVPAGYQIELAAAPPLVKHPMMAGFDDRGRLFIAEAAGENLRRPDLEEQLPNFVRMLEDTDHDGVFDRSTIFADKLTFPMGALWHEGALFVASSGAIWRFEDSDDDGVADLRTKIVSDFGYSGNGADVHGCFLGPCGRIYWCEGRHGHEFRDANEQVTSAGKAARIFSCKPDGSDVQIHCGGGMDNPVEIDFLPTGEMVGTVNIMFRQRGDCLVHWMHGGVYPRHDQPQVTGEFRRTGGLLPPVHNFGHVAVSGMTRYRGTQLGESFTGNLFVTEFNTHKVKRVHLRRDGPTFSAETEDFLTSTFGDFHPTDVLEDADGSLLVIDTGGWFRIGCPTSQIAKPNVLGAIYRIRREGGIWPVPNPRREDLVWAEQTISELAGLVRSGNPTVCGLAVNELVRRGDASVKELASWLAIDDASDASTDLRFSAVWGLGRIGSDAACKVLRDQLEHPLSAVRLASATALGILRDQASSSELIALLADEEPAIRREAATALGRIGCIGAAPQLFAALRGQVHRVEEHAMIFALIEIGETTATHEALASDNPRVRRAALIALDQMSGQPLTREMVAGLLETDDLELRTAALEVIARHPTWGDEIVEVAGRMLTRDELSPSEQAVLSGSLLAFAQNPAIQRVVADSLADASTPNARKRQILEVIAQTGLTEIPPAWSQQIRLGLSSPDPLLVEQAVKTIASIGLADVEMPLQQIARTESQPIDLRIAALDVLAARGQSLDRDQFQLLTAQLDPEVPPLRRLAAARCLGAAKLQPAQLDDLARHVARAGALELPALVGAFEQQEMEAAAGKRLAVALLKSPGLTSLSADRVSRLFGGPGSAAAEPLLSKLKATTAEQAERLAELQQSMQSGGDPARGKEVFHGRQAACFTCHRVANEGGQIGPDLSQIGTRRNDRDLLEAIVYPSTSLARGFEGYTIVTATGRVISGLITRETAQAVFVRTADQHEVRIPRGAIEEMSPNGVSIMPAGLDRTMQPDQLRDLVAYLRSLK